MNFGRIHNRRPLMNIMNEIRVRHLFLVRNKFEIVGAADTISTNHQLVLLVIVLHVVI